MHANQLRNGHLLAQHGIFLVDRIRIGPPLHSLIGKVQAVEDVVVEIMLAKQ